MKILGVIPARYGSTRFEGKPLVMIEGYTMIEWVYRRALKSNLDSVVIATDDERIYNEVIRFKGNVVMTSKNHPTGTDRIAEVAKKYSDYELIINIQGDEPLIEPEMINSLIEPFKENTELVMGTLKHKIKEEKDVINPNIVKVITDKNDFAIYFSRSPIPYDRNEFKNYYRHIGIYAYKNDFLLKYSAMLPTELEKAESLEQLRAIENGHKIKVINTEFEVKGVDTPKDLEEVIRFIKEKNIKI